MLLLPAAARADGDPASDYLYTQSLFLPLDGSIPKASEAQLRALLGEAKAKALPGACRRHRLAGRPRAVPSLYGKPNRYAPFLGQELRFLFKGPLLVVMPGGYGFYWLAHDTTAGEKALAALPPPAQAPDLARAAVPAVQRLAVLQGVELGTPPLAESGGGGSETRDRIVIAIGALVVATLVAAGLRWRRRR